MSETYVNKVEYAGETLMDLTGDTVTSENLLAGETAHGADGAPVIGNYSAVNTFEFPLGGGSNMKFHQYSTEEQVVGKWIDGNILYEKTVKFNLSSQTDIYIAYSLPTDCDIVKYDIKFLLTNGDIVQNPYIPIGFKYEVVGIEARINKNNINIIHGMDRSNLKCIATLNYIKN